MASNGENPVVFVGSSNLSAGGETRNGDNLLALFDRRLASAYAVEAIRLIDHYHFRAVLKGASSQRRCRSNRTGRGVLGGRHLTSQAT